MRQKQLPPNPNLEHLKSQAKKLLKAYRGDSDDAIDRIRSFFPRLANAADVEIQQAEFGLQDAQLVIAREYGFENWSRLKERVIHLEQNAAEDTAKEILFKIIRAADIDEADISKVKALIAADSSLISAKDDEGRTPVEALVTTRRIINVIASRPRKTIYNILMEQGAKPDLITAIAMDDIDRVAQLIDANPQLIRQRFNIPGPWAGVNPLAIAAGYARTKIARVLIETDSSLVNAKEDEGKSPMDLLVKPWHHSAFEYEPRKPIYDLLIENGATPDVCHAIIMNDVARVTQLINANPQLLEQQFVCGNGIKFRPLAIAAAYGRTEILDLLFSAATEIQIDVHEDLDEGLYSTFNLSVTEWLITTIKPSPKILEKPLAFACEVYQPEKVRLLLKYGADPNARVKAKFHYDVVQNLKPSEYQMSPLLIAIGTWYGVRDGGIDECLEIVETLIENGADLSQTYTVDIAGEVSDITVLDYARTLATLFPDKPFDEVIEVLQKYDSSVK